MSHAAHLKCTVTLALVVGTILFCINQLDVVLRGQATRLVWLKSAVTYLVPFAVANIGVLIGSRHLDGGNRGDDAAPSAEAK